MLGPWNKTKQHSDFFPANCSPSCLILHLERVVGSLVQRSVLYGVPCTCSTLHHFPRQPCLMVAMTILIAKVLVCPPVEKSAYVSDPSISKLPGAWNLLPSHPHPSVGTALQVSRTQTTANLLVASDALTCGCTLPQMVWSLKDPCRSRT